MRDFWCWISELRAKLAERRHRLGDGGRLGQPLLRWRCLLPPTTIFDSISLGAVESYPVLAVTFKYAGAARRPWPGGISVADDDMLRRSCWR